MKKEWMKPEFSEIEENLKNSSSEAFQIIKDLNTQKQSRIKIQNKNTIQNKKRETALQNLTTSQKDGQSIAATTLSKKTLVIQKS